MRYDGCETFDLHVEGDLDGIWVAGDGAKIDDICPCFEQAVRM
jgi:hypothetical protein